MSRREELLAVATKLFAARGYHGTRMDDVADAVGLNKATVYHYYASKSLILYDIYKGCRRLHGGRAARRPVGVRARDDLPLHPQAVGRHRRRPRAGGGVFPGGPYITEWFTAEQVAYIREKETQVYEHVRDVIDRGSPAASSTTATPMCSRWDTSG